jgi:hypothetical protein
MRACVCVCLRALCLRLSWCMNVCIYTWHICALGMHIPNFSIYAIIYIYIYIYIITMCWSDESACADEEIP